MPRVRVSFERTEQPLGASPIPETLQLQVGDLHPYFGLHTDLECLVDCLEQTIGLATDMGGIDAAMAIHHPG